MDGDRYVISSTAARKYADNIADSIIDDIEGERGELSEAQWDSLSQQIYDEIFYDLDGLTLFPNATVL